MFSGVPSSCGRVCPGEKEQERDGKLTDHHFLKLVYPDAAKTENLGGIMLNELIRNSLAIS